MKLEVACAKCINLRDPSDKSHPEWIEGELDDSGIVFVDCPSGHHSAVLYDIRRYEILMYSATKALLDGYINESVSTYSSALERAYEFFLRVVFRSKGIEYELFEKTWKAVANQSERQYGAFLFMYLVETNNTFELDTEIPQYRNKIVHKGKIARESDAMKFAEKVYDKIHHIEIIINEKYKQYAIDEKQSEINRQEKLIPKDMEYIFLKSFAVKLNNENDVIGFPETFSEYIKSVYKGMKKGTAKYLYTSK